MQRQAYPPVSEVIWPILLKTDKVNPEDRNGMSEKPQSSAFVYTEPIKVSLADGRKGVAITWNKDHADRTDVFDYAARGVLPWLNSSIIADERSTDVQPVIVMNQLPRRILGQVFWAIILANFVTAVFVLVVLGMAGVIR